MKCRTAETKPDFIFQFTYQEAQLLCAIFYQIRGDNDGPRKTVEQILNFLYDNGIRMDQEECAVFLEKDQTNGTINLIKEWPKVDQK